MSNEFYNKINYDSFEEEEQKSNNYEFDNSGFKSKDYEDVDEFNIWDLEQIFKDRVKVLQDINNEFFSGFEQPKYKSSRRDDRRERLQPLSIRVKPHTKRFLREDSPLSAREILELYEEFNNGNEDYINSLVQDEIQLKEELSEIEEKLKNARKFTEKLNEIKAKKAAEKERAKEIKVNIE